MYLLNLSSKNVENEDTCCLYEYNISFFLNIYKKLILQKLLFFVTIKLLNMNII